MIFNIVNPKINPSRRHRYAKVGELLYLVSLYGYNTDDSTWNPTRHLSFGKILSYYRNNKLPIPNSIDLAEDGWSMHDSPRSCSLEVHTGHQPLSSFSGAVPWKPTLQLDPTITAEYHKVPDTVPSWWRTSRRLTEKETQITKQHRTKIHYS